MAGNTDGIHVLEDDRLRVIVDSACGGKLRSLVSKSTGEEFFYTDPRSEFSSAGYSLHDVSGFDECFPTVAPCDYVDGRWDGMPLGDHGLLWNRTWQVHPMAGAVAMAVELPEIPLRFERVCRLTEKGLQIDYSLTNRSDEAFEFLYAAHILLRADRTTRIHYPTEMDQGFVYAAFHLPEVQELAWLDWPPDPKTGITTDLDPSRGTLVKLFSPALHSAQAVITHGDGRESLAIDFDHTRLPHLGILLAQGFNPVERDRQGLFVGLEPTTGIGDDFATCRQTNTTAKIPPGESTRFWIRLSLQQRQRPLRTT